MWYVYTMDYYSAIKKEWNNAICSNMDRPGNYHTKWSKSDKVRQVDDIAYMWNIKMIQMSLFTEQKQAHRFKKQTLVAKGGKW